MDVMISAQFDAAMGDCDSNLQGNARLHLHDQILSVRRLATLKFRHILELQPV